MQTMIDSISTGNSIKSHHANALYHRGVNLYYFGYEMKEHGIEKKDEKLISEGETFMQKAQQNIDLAVEMREQIG